MGYRRKSRELAMQALFYMDMIQKEPDEMIDLFCKNFKPSKQVLPFLFTLITGVLQRKDEIDGIIEQFSSNWKVSRMAGVDRNILRIAVFELLWVEEIPSKVSINEAIDIAKKYGTDESGAFINGILDSIRKLSESEGIQIKLHSSKGVARTSDNQTTG
jgi:transcription antitermination protein NusB